MEIILKEDIKGLGYKDDIVTVKGGHGRNYLIPQGMAVIASPSNKKMIEENIRTGCAQGEQSEEGRRGYRLETRRRNATDSSESG